MTVEQLPELYWTTVSWAAAIAADTQDMDLLVDLKLIDQMIYRCLDLDASFDEGAIHEFLIAFDGGRSSVQGGSLTRAREHFAKAMQYGRARKVAPLVSLAEHVAVSEQRKKEFERLLQRALAFDVDKAPERRLVNLVAQKRAAVLLSHVDDLFLGD